MTAFELGVAVAVLLVAMALVFAFLNGYTLLWLLHESLIHMENSEDEL